MTAPKILENPLAELLREGKTDEFNQQRAHMHEVDFKFGDFRSVDLRGMNADGVDFTGAYLRHADIRGLDLRNAKLEHASICKANISGVLFPENISANEIQMSLEHGTRMRITK